MRRKGRGRKAKKMMDGQRHTASTSKLIKHTQNFSLSAPKEPSPWDKLPRELLVKILQNLPRCDLIKCRFLNRTTFETIRSNERCLVGRTIDTLSVSEDTYALAFRVHCEEDGMHNRLLVRKQRRFKRIPRPSLKSLQGARQPFASYTSCLPRVLTNADVREMWIGEMSLTDGVLSTISSVLLDARCRVNKLDIYKTRMATVTSSAFDRFLRNINPEEISLSRLGPFQQDFFSPELLRFIVMRERFSLTNFEGPIPIDDDILARLTATDFQILVPNRITLNGLNRFYERLTGEWLWVTKAIFVTNFLVSREMFPEEPNVGISVLGDYCIMFKSQKPIRWPLVSDDFDDD